MRAGFRVIAFVHDEFLIELPDGVDFTARANQIEEICCKTMEQFTPGVEITAEYALADRWSKDAERVERDGKLVAWHPSPDKLLQHPRDANEHSVESGDAADVHSNFGEKFVAQVEFDKADVSATPMQPTTREKRVQIPFRWHGGKGADNGKLAKWIISLMPKHIHYVEPFFGGGSVLFFKQPDGFSELANDLHGSLINFYQVLRDTEEFAELKRLIELTPMNQDEFALASVRPEIDILR